MRRFGLRGGCAIVVSMSCSCGSSGSSVSGGTAPDASVDAPLADGPIDASSAGDSPADAAADGPPLMSTTCDNAGLLAGCVAGQCTVGATGKPLADGVSITVTQKPAPADLNGDTLGAVLCSIDLPAGVATLPNLGLSIALAAAPPANAVLFQYVSSSLSRAVATSQPTGSAVGGLVTAPGTFGATERPAPWSVQSDFGLDTSSSADQASLLRNLSSQGMYAAFYDGTHLFVCNGARLLVYSGIPAAPSVAPTFVLGAPDLNTVIGQTTSSLFGAAGCSTVWSDGTRLVVGSGNRILIWNAMPSQNAAPADIVLGQPDFSSNQPNNGGVGASTLSAVVSVDSDGTRLLAADRLNHRFLIWNKFPAAVGQPADLVVGQPDFTTNLANDGATPINQAWGGVFVQQGLFLAGLFNPGVVHVAAVPANNPPIDFTVLSIGYKLQPPNALFAAARIARAPNGGLALRDPLQRIAMLRQVPTGPATIDFVLGQPDPVHTVTSAVSASVVSGPNGEYGLGAGQVMLAPDSRRLLVFDTSPTFNFAPASRVIGQAGFTTNGQVDYRGISASTLAGPADVAVGGGFVAVGDRGNNRVLLYRATDIAAGNLDASVVLGQPDAASYVPNLDQQTPSAARMSGPAGIALDGTHLIVADTENHRVLIWNSVPSATATPADLVLGQTDFSGRRPNRGRGDANGDGFSDSDANGFFYPTGVASDGTHLFVADRLNNRVLVWNHFPTSNGQVADAVIGQANFTTSQANKGNGPFTFVPDGLNLPTGVTLAGTTLWIADTENNRLVRWDLATTNPTAGAWIGQSSGSVVSNSSYYLDTELAIGQVRNPGPATTSGSVLHPRAVAVVGGKLYVSESGSNRVHVLDAASYAPLGELGQSGDSVGGLNATGVSASSLATPLGLASDGSTLWVADSVNHRVLGYSLATAPSTGAAAAVVLGQPGYLTNGFNQTSTAASGATSQPRGTAFANGKLYVADTSNNRVLVMATPIVVAQQPAGLYGQPDATLALPNSGGPPSASTLNGPQGIFADLAHVIVADTANNRVLVYDATAMGGAATLVLGQPTFTTTPANSGGPTASTMQGPTAAYSNGTSLWVGDTGNHRVLVWNAFPTSNGQPADLVLGQPSFSAVLPNQGNAAASASSLSFPTGIVVINGVLYVSDTGNNRVVWFSTRAAASGPSADGVLGQADLLGRTPAVSATDMTHLAGPIALAADGENLYVVDRDLGRVLGYALGTLKSGSPANLSIGSTGGLALTSPSGIAVERTPFFTSRLYIGDTGGNQVAIVQSVSRLASQ
jgi:NHL repeat-containing protein